jgi:uncharacterized protein YjbI with pentapeptide repeats/energy-coupling factor transporter ATP-binding protein EcfA2
MIELQPAAVRPRVVSAGGEALLLEDEVRRLLAAGTRGVVALLGPAGSGKTTALRHLAAVLPPDAPVTLLDGPDYARWAPDPGRLVVYAPASPPKPSVHAQDILTDLIAVSPGPGALRLIDYRLAPWGRDDLIEYLLSAHRPRCASAIRRVPARQRVLLGGLPELWAAVLDRLAADEALHDALAALHRYLEEHLSDTDLLGRARSACLNAQVAAGEGLDAALAALARPGFAPALVRALRHPAAQLLLAAERVAADLRGEGDCDVLALRLPRELVKTAGTLIADDGRTLARLHGLLDGPPWSHAMAVSLLHATGTGWLLQARHLTALAGAYLDGARWPCVRLANADLTETDLSGSDLFGANLLGARALKAGLSRARLREAILNGLVAVEADLSHADLSQADAATARFDRANLEGARLHGATLFEASFVEANLTAAELRDANLTGSVLTGARLEGADFAGANLSGADLTGLCLREARWEGANFAAARMGRCDLEYLALPAACFERAYLTGALLTGTTMPGANFEYACLCEAGLADVEWEGASLRGADLRGASFHMGSCRSGLVGSPIPCEGSRTGFYTDEFDEQTYKAPEEIRKANLCGADLRGALLDGVDFYLVDLRGAQYDPDQEEHLRRSGAILEARV